jgi:MFS family permease
MLAVGTIITYTWGVFAQAIGREFGWSSLELSWPLTAFFYALVLGSFGCGVAIDRFGPRRVILASTVMLALGLGVIATLPPSIPAFAAALALLAIAAAGTLPIGYARVLVSAFLKQRGLALGIALTGVGAGGAVLPILAQTLIDGYGWRDAYMLLGGAVALVSLPLAAAFIPRLPAGEKDGPDRLAQGAAPVLGNPVPLALLAAISLICGAFLTGLVVHLVPILVDGGLSAPQAARMAGAMGASIILGRLAIGALMDRFKASRVLAIFLIGPGLAAVLLASGNVATIALPAAILTGLAQGAEVDAVAYLVSRHFSAASFGAVYGAMFGLFMLGAANGPLFIGWARSVFGSYDRPLIVTAALALVTVLLAALLPQPRQPGLQLGR